MDAEDEAAVEEEDNEAEVVCRAFEWHCSKMDGGGSGCWWCGRWCNSCGWMMFC